MFHRWFRFYPQNELYVGHNLSEEQLAEGDDNAALDQVVLVDAPCHGDVLALLLDCVFYPRKNCH